MLNNFQTRRNQCALGAPHQRVINERSAHWVLQPILVNSKNYESDCGLYHHSSHSLADFSVCDRRER